jgi:hypothetical protein
MQSMCRIGTIIHLRQTRAYGLQAGGGGVLFSEVDCVWVFCECAQLPRFVAVAHTNQLARTRDISQQYSLQSYV